MKKIKVFLGGYINSINAQNLNCLALARHLDKKRFDVYAMTIYSGNIENVEIDNVHLLNAFYPHRISKYLIYLYATIKCDILYLPKRELCGWTLFWVRFFRKKSFTTVEGIYGDEMLQQVLASGMTYKAFKERFARFDRVYSITSYLRRYNEEHHGIQTEKKILYLGTDTEIFLNENKTTTKLENIIFIGRLKRRKGVFEVLEIAKNFPDLNFFLAGNGEDKEEIESYIKKYGLKNVRLLGTLPHPQLAKVLETMDLHLFPSRSEGFPKVTLETAAAGIPSVVYPDYGADEWITDGVNGFIVDTIDQMTEVIQKLRNDPEKLRQVSQNAIDLAKRFDWNVQIKEWESIIETLNVAKLEDH